MLERVNQVLDVVPPGVVVTQYVMVKSHVISPLMTREIHSNSVSDGLSRTSDQQCNQTRFLYL